MEIVLKRIYSAHTKYRINAKPADLGRSRRRVLSPPSLEIKIATAILKKPLSETVFSQPGRGKLLIIDNFSPGWGQRRVGFLSRADKAL